MKVVWMELGRFKRNPECVEWLEGLKRNSRWPVSWEICKGLVVRLLVSSQLLGTLTRTAVDWGSVRPLRSIAWLPMKFRVFPSGTLWCPELTDILIFKPEFYELNSEPRRGQRHSLMRAIETWDQIFPTRKRIESNLVPRWIKNHFECLV